VDLRLGDEVAFFKQGLPFTIDLQRGSFTDLFLPNSESRTITTDQPFILQPGRLVLAKTLEMIELPLIEGAPCLAARVEGKSSYARCGLLAHFTAPTTHAGFRGTITLELINLGPIPIQLTPGAPICQLIIEQVDGLPFQNESQFHGQSRAGGKV
jgi:dCTP deaminase